MSPDEGQAMASIREVISLIEQSRRDVIGEIEKLKTRVDAKFEGHTSKHETEQETHKVEHRREADRRASYIRWAVTTIMTGAGVLFSIWLALQGP